MFTKEVQEAFEEYEDLKISMKVAEERMEELKPIILEAMLSGVEIDPMATETFVTAALTFLASTGAYFFAK